MLTCPRRSRETSHTLPKPSLASGRVAATFPPIRVLHLLYAAPEDTHRRPLANLMDIRLPPRLATARIVAESTSGTSGALRRSDKSLKLASPVPAPDAATSK